MNYSIIFTDLHYSIIFTDLVSLQKLHLYSAFNKELLAHTVGEMSSVCSVIQAILVIPGVDL